MNNLGQENSQNFGGSPLDSNPSINLLNTFDQGNIQPYNSDG